MNITAIIPTLNEENTIGYIIEKTKKYVNKVLVVDGGSVDQTCMISADLGADVLLLQKLAWII